MLPTRKFRKYLLLCDTWMVQIKVEDPDPGHRERPFKGRGRGYYMCYTIWDQVEQASRESHKLLLCGKYKSPWKGLDLEHKIWKSRISRWDKFTMHLFFPHLKLACFKIHDILVGNILRALKDWRTLFWLETYLLDDNEKGGLVSWHLFSWTEVMLKDDNEKVYQTLGLVLWRGSCCFLNELLTLSNFFFSFAEAIILPLLITVLLVELRHTLDDCCCMLGAHPSSRGGYHAFWYTIIRLWEYFKYKFISTIFSVMTVLLVGGALLEFPISCPKAWWCSKMPQLPEVVFQYLLFSWVWIEQDNNNQDGIFGRRIWVCIGHMKFLSFYKAISCHHVALRA